MNNGSFGVFAFPWDIGEVSQISREKPVFTYLLLNETFNDNET